MFRYADESLFPCLLVQVTEMDIEELHATDLFKLFFDTPAFFEGIGQTALYRLFVI